VTTSENGRELVERLLAAAEGTPEETSARLAGEDCGAVAEAVLTEVLSRTALFEGLATPITVQFDLDAGGERLGYAVTVAGGKADIRPARLDEPWVLVRQELDELVRAVYGPPHRRCDATREVTIRDLPGPVFDSASEGPVRRHAAGLAAHQMICAMTPYRADLRALAVRFGSDKWAGHWYARHYERHFAEYRDQRVRLLEIGIGGYADDLGGGSLHMWKHYFPRGLVHGLDLHDKSKLDGPRLRTVQGSQSDPAFLAELADRIGPLDIVIDDGSHLSSDVLITFAALFPRLRPGGIYVIEDLQTSYWPGWNGDRTDVDDPATSTGFLKTLVDGLHYQERGAGEPSATERQVVALHIYHGIAFVEKGTNADQPAPAWIPRDTNPMAYGTQG
jgi:MycE methyltransferase N-terminal